MKIRRLYIPVILVLCVLSVVSNLYQWDRQNRIKENVGEQINQRLSMIYGAVNRELTPDMDVSNMPDITSDLEVLNYLAGIYSQFLGSSNRDRNISTGMDNLTILLSDYHTLYNAIGEGLPYNQSKEFQKSLNAYLALVADIPDVTQHDLDERLLVFYHARQDSEMLDMYGNLSEISEKINRLSAYTKKDFS